MLKWRFTETNAMVLIYMWNAKKLNLEAEQSDVTKGKGNRDAGHSGHNQLGWLCSVDPLHGIVTGVIRIV